MPSRHVTAHTLDGCLIMNFDASLAVTLEIPGLLPSADEHVDDPRSVRLPTAQEQIEAHLGAHQAAEDLLRERVAEAEADKVARDRRFAAQDAKIAEQDKVIAELRSSRAGQDERIARLEADLGRVAVTVGGLRKRPGEQRPSTEIAGRVGGGQAERAERGESQRRRRLPADPVRNVISLAPSEVITDLAYHGRDLPPEHAGIGASEFALGRR
jgi:uncharacterized coiled-coil protein SlyX